jgi:glycosyltransferase involved in cell wall biosynthesis
VKVSIVTPSFQQGRFIERTLRSVASQEGADIEHLVFDAGSTDATVSILQAFRSPLKWVSEPDRGQADAVNKGIRASAGEIVGWLNSDDVYYPGAVARAAAIFQSHPEVDVVYGRADHIDEQDRPFEPYPTEPWNLERLSEFCFLCQPAVFLRRGAIDRHGLLDESLRYCMDYEWWLRLGHAGARFAYVEKKLAGSRLYAGNKTLGSRPEVHEEINGMLKARLGRVPERWLVNYAFASVGSGAGALHKARVLLAAIRAGRRWNGGLTGIDLRKLLRKTGDGP